MKDDVVKMSVFTVKDENGKSIECEVLFTFSSPETGKDYVVYTDHTTDESGSMKVYANIYDKNNKSKNLLPIETTEEWNTIEAILAKLENQTSEDK